MYSKSLITKVAKILYNNKTNYWTGNNGRLFETEFARYHGLKYSVCVSNGSVALEMALKALGLKNNSAVIVTPRSFIISAVCVLKFRVKAYIC